MPVGQAVSGVHESEVKRGVRIVTLTTDFGLKDGNVGVMKGVIWGIAPQVHIADLSHGVAPQNIREAGFILVRCVPYFPPGTIHVVVVDPGVGTERRHLAARLGTQYFVGPDNGVITALLEYAEERNWDIELVHANRREYWLHEVSHVFHGRDVFAPIAAHLANGVALKSLGTPINDPVRLPLPRAQRTQNGWVGEVIHIDHFGNIATNIRRQDMGEPGRVQVRLRGANVPGLMRTFGEHPPGELIALYGSTGYLIVSEVNGNAAQRLQAQVGDRVEVWIEVNPS